MTAATLRDLVGRSPFQPLDVHLADGRVIPVLHHDFVMISPVERDFVVYQPDGKIDWIDTQLVTGVTPKQNGTPA